MPIKKVVVTGSSGKAGRAIVADLSAHGYEVVGVDLVRSASIPVRQLIADLTNLGEAMEVLEGADAVVHMAAIPAPGLYAEERTFRNNVESTFNIFQAAVARGLRRVVWASSETTLGLPFDREKPAYAPIDESHPLYPESSYALSKVLSEEMARQFNRRFGIPFVGFRISNIMEPERYREFPGFQKDPNIRRWNLWGYIDVRDVALITRLALERDTTGAQVFIAAAADTVMARSSRELMAEIYPDVPVRKDLGTYETLLSIDSARKVLGFVPQYTWRNQV